MTIHNLEAYIDGLWDWGNLDMCFDHGIRISDLDGIVERNGKFLVLEAKSPNVAIPRGQEIMFEKMVENGMSVLILWGETNKPTRAKIFTPALRSGKTFDFVGWEQVQKIVSRWYEWADSKS